MAEIIYKHSFGEKNRIAVHKFVTKVKRKVEFVERPKAAFGPEGQVIVYCTFASNSDAKEKAVRRVMAKASQQVLNSNDVWIVGIPEKIVPAAILRKSDRTLRKST